PAVTLGPPTAALGAPRDAAAPPDPIQPASLTWTAPSRVVRAQIDDKAPMPQGQAQPQPGGSAALPPPTPLGPSAPAPGMPLVSGPFLTNPDLAGPVVSGPVVGGPLPGGPCCGAGLAPLPGGYFAPDAHPAGYMLYGSAEY